MHSGKIGRWDVTTTSGTWIRSVTLIVTVNGTPIYIAFALTFGSNIAVELCQDLLEIFSIKEGVFVWISKLVSYICEFSAG